MPEELAVYMSNWDAVCSECGAPIAKNDRITLKHPHNDPVCLSCSDLDHLVYLPSGNAALTTRARKYSPLSAVVLKRSRARKRTERRGALVSAEALARAEEECLSDEERRAARRERDRIRREKLEVKYVQEFADAVLRLFPGCPEATATWIAEHACEKYSGRVGRSAGAKALVEGYIRLPRLRIPGLSTHSSRSAFTSSSQTRTTVQPAFSSFSWCSQRKKL